MKTRGFELVSSIEGGKIPTRGTKASAGYDFYLLGTVVINPGETVLCNTGIKAYMQEDEVLEIYPRSSLATKKGVRLANSVGIIDSDYYNNLNNEGHIMIPLYNFSDETVILGNHDRIAQGIFKKYLTIDDEEVIDTERIGGFGSTND